MKKTIPSLITLTLVFALILTFLSIQSVVYASTSSANKKAHAIFEKEIKKITQSCRDHSVYYKYVDLTGDSEHDVLLCYQTEDSGSASTYVILTRNGKKAKKIFTTNTYGLEKLTFYKKGKSVVSYSAGHGGETYSYYKMKSGKYKAVASKSRASLAGGGSENGKWNYYDAKGKTLSKSGFNAKIKGLQKVSKKSVRISDLKLYQA